MIKTWQQAQRENEKKTKVSIVLYFVFVALIGLSFDVIASVSIYPFFKITFAPFCTLTLLTVCFLVSVWSVRHMEDMFIHDLVLTPINEQSQLAEHKKIWYLYQELLAASKLKFTPRLVLSTDALLNAFAYGWNKENSTIVITQGLVNLLDPQELKAVLAHELTHIQNQDVKLMASLAASFGALYGILDFYFEFSLRTRSGFLTSLDNDSESDSLNKLMLIVLLVKVFLFIIYAAFPLIEKIALAYISRKREYMADAGAVQLTRYQEALASALYKIHQVFDQIPQDSNVIRKASSLYASDGMFSTHPNLMNRLANLNESVQSVKMRLENKPKSSADNQGIGRFESAYTKKLTHEQLKMLLMGSADVAFSKQRMKDEPM